MTQLPPPSLPGPHPDPAPDDATPSSRRRWAIGAGIAGSGLAVAAIVAGTTAIASSGSSADAPTAVATEAVPTVERDGSDELPPELDEFITGAEQFGQCLAEQLDLPTDGAMHGGSGTVIVTDPNGEGELTIIEFGEGDGSVTVERSGDDITVDSDGDVTVTDGEDIMSNLDDFFADAGTAFEACRDQLPELPPLDDVIGSIPGLEDFNLDDFNLDDFNLDDFDLDQLPNLDEFDLDPEQLPSLDELQEQLPNLDEFLQDLENLDLDQLFGDLFDQQN